MCPEPSAPRGNPRSCPAASHLRVQSVHMGRASFGRGSIPPAEPLRRCPRGVEKLAAPSSSHAGARRTFGRAASALGAFIQSRAFTSLCIDLIGLTPFIQGFLPTPRGFMGILTKQRKCAVKAHSKNAKSREILRTYINHTQST